MGKADVAVKIWLNDNERFADLFNGAIFGGETVILPDELEDLERETDILITDKQGKSRDLRRHRDLVKRWRKKVKKAEKAGRENRMPPGSGMELWNSMICSG